METHKGTGALTGKTDVGRPEFRPAWVLLIRQHLRRACIPVKLQVVRHESACMSECKYAQRLGERDSRV